jgi:hypothetical protein
MLKSAISADSHVTEPPGTYVDRIDRRYRDRAPHIVRDAQRGDVFVVDGMPKSIPMGLVAAAGKDASELTMWGARFEDLHRGGWDPDARMADQDRDGVSAEVVYPTVGMMICNHPDFDSSRPASTRITYGSRSSAGRIPTVSSGWARPRCARSRTASPISSASRPSGCAAS